MPFNSELEFMDKSMLQANIQLTHELDRSFGLPPKVTMSQVRHLHVMFAMHGCDSTNHMHCRMMLERLSTAGLSCSAMFQVSHARQSLFWWIKG